MLSVNHVQWELTGPLRHLPVLILSSVVHEVHTQVMDENPGAVVGEMTLPRKTWILLGHGF